MYDLHAHILPGVDDGAKTPEDTLEMARAAAKDGTRVILATPHRRDVTENWSVAHVREQVAEANQRIEDAGLDITMRLGMENHLDVDLPEEVEQGRALSMAGSRYILVELPFFGRPNYVEEVLFQVQSRGLTPVLAHPERLEVFHAEPELLVTLVERGMLTQVTAGSLEGYFGKNVRKFTEALFRHGLVHILASDTHFPGGPRSPKLTPGVEAASKIVGQEQARNMVVATPKAVLDDLPIDVPSPGPWEASSRWWQFWQR